MAASGRIPEALARLRAQGRRALVPFFTIGDPDMAATEQAVLAAVDAGADIIELGVPFSDPIADGPVIQASSQRALAAGASLPRSDKNGVRSTSAPSSRQPRRRS